MADTNIFISDLPAEIDEETLKTIFGAYGTVTYGIVFQSKGKPTSAGIIEFSSVDEATWVVQNVNGNVPQGLSSAVTVAFKKPRAEKGKAKGFGKGKGFGFGKGFDGGKFGGDRFAPYGGGDGFGGKGKGFGGKGWKGCEGGKGFGKKGW
eukprot:TRINITY_DN2814_c0_g3_i1.p1 TRINITY_DN2814_c0_g3~~TRINITY_DN2814_c0_g3_i1.p1  ORF type:complete len:175 (-),score=39.56 TRINITY_DN2814_c0_g3_i1:143-592(-)